MEAQDPDDTQPGGTEVDPEGGAEPAGQEPDESSGPGATGSDTDSESVSDLKAKLAQANREAAKYRKERNTAQAELKKRTDAELSEVEREKKRADEAEIKLTESMARVQSANLRVALSQHKVGIVDTDTAALLLTQRGIEFDDEGQPQDIETAIDTLVKDKPFLAGAGTGNSRQPGGINAGAGSGETGGVQLTADELIMAQAFKMSPEDYAKWKDKV